MRKLILFFQIPKEATDQIQRPILTGESREEREEECRGLMVVSSLVISFHSIIIHFTMV